MTPRDRERAYLARRRRELQRYITLRTETVQQIRGLLDQARVAIVQQLRDSPSDWSQAYYQRQLGAVDSAIGRWGDRTADAWRSSLAAAWSLGDDLVQQPLRAAGIGPAAFGTISDRQLAGMQGFTTRKIGEISAGVRQQIEAQLGLVLSGAQSSGQATDNIQAILGSSRKRAVTITRTELGRAYATATFERLRDTAKRVPGMQKQWRRSGKIHSRFDHDLADGQIKDVEDHFQIGGERLMYPRDPTASAKNTINCGCTLLPYKKDWKDDVRYPGRQPFTSEEIAAQPHSRSLIDELNQPAAPAIPTVGTALTLDDALLAGREVLAALKPRLDAATTGDAAVGVILEALRKVREVGGKVPIKGTKEAALWANMATDVYPADWNRQATAYGTLYVRLQNGRAWHFTASPQFVADLRRPDRMRPWRHNMAAGDGYILLRRSRVTAVHEYAHRLQATVPGLDALFQALHRRRTAGESLITIYPGEFGRRDQYVNPYTGKEYPDRGVGQTSGALEVITMAYQALLGGNLGELRDLLEHDEELARLALGVLWRF